MPLPVVQFSSEKEKSVYSKYFTLVLPPGSSIYKLPADTDVKAFFRLSRLPKNILEKIWDYVHQTSTIDQNSFNVCLRMIALAQQDMEPNLLGLNSNTHLLQPPRFVGHESVLLLMDIDVTKVAWKVSPAEIVKFKPQFTPNAAGVLTYDQGIKFFALSGVNFVFLQHIWFLSDYDQDMALDFDEFCVAMHIIHGMLDGRYTSLPTCLPIELIPPSKRGGLHESVKMNTAPSFEPVAAKTGFNWDISQQALSKYNTLWLGLSLNKPTITKASITEISLHSQVAEALCQIAWSLVDVQRQSRITKEQFYTLMHIVDQIHNGLPPPTSLPNELSEKFAKISLTAPSLYASSATSFSTPNIAVEIVNAHTSQFRPPYASQARKSDVSLQTSNSQNLFESPPRSPSYDFGAANVFNDYTNIPKSRSGSLADGGPRTSIPDVRGPSIPSTPVVAPTTASNAFKPHINQPYSSSVQSPVLSTASSFGRPSVTTAANSSPYVEKLGITPKPSLAPSSRTSMSLKALEQVLQATSTTPSPASVASPILHEASQKPISQVKQPPKLEAMAQKKILVEEKPPKLPFDDNPFGNDIASTVQPVAASHTKSQPPKFPQTQPTKVEISVQQTVKVEDNLQKTPVDDNPFGDDFVAPVKPVATSPTTTHQSQPPKFPQKQPTKELKQTDLPSRLQENLFEKKQIEEYQKKILDIKGEIKGLTTQLEDMKRKNADLEDRLNR